MGCCQTDSKKSEESLQITISPKNQPQSQSDSFQLSSEENLPSIRIKEYALDSNDLSLLDKIYLQNEEYYNQANSGKNQSQRQFISQEKNYELPMPLIVENLNEDSDFEKSQSIKSRSFRNTLEIKCSQDEEQSSNESQKKPFQPFGLIVDVDVIENPTPKFSQKNKQNQNEINEGDSENLNNSQINESRQSSYRQSPDKSRFFELKLLDLNSSQINDYETAPQNQEEDEEQNQKYLYSCKLYQEKKVQKPAGKYSNSFNEYEKSFNKSINQALSLNQDLEETSEAVNFGSPKLSIQLEQKESLNMLKIEEVVLDLRPDQLQNSQNKQYQNQKTGFQFSWDQNNENQKQEESSFNTQQFSEVKQIQIDREKLQKKSRQTQYIESLNQKKKVLYRQRSKSI